MLHHIILYCTRLDHTSMLYHVILYHITLYCIMLRLCCIILYCPLLYWVLYHIIVYLHTHIHKCTNAQIHVYTHTHIHIDTYAHTHAHAFRHTHTDSAMILQGMRTIASHLVLVISLRAMQLLPYFPGPPSRSGHQQCHGDRLRCSTA